MYEIYLVLFLFKAIPPFKQSTTPIIGAVQQLISIYFLSLDNPIEKATADDTTANTSVITNV